MKIETKFNVTDLTQKKYDRFDDTVLICEIFEIHPIVCIAGTQVFYTVRHIVLKRIKHFMEKGQKNEWTVERAIQKDNTIPKFREDELIPCSDEYRKIILGK